jgi:hypothetical protein
MPTDTFLKRTNQLWKLIVGGIVLPIPLVWWGWRGMRHIRPDQPTSEFVLDIAVLVAGALVSVWLYASVRCPKCRARLVKHVMKAPEGADAITSFLQSRACPACGYTP